MEETPSITCTSCLPARRGFTRAEYMLAAEVGILKPDERLELIEGEIYLKMSPQKAPHATTIRLVENALNRIFSEGHDVRVQLPLALGERSEPEPDVALPLPHFLAKPDDRATRLRTLFTVKTQLGVLFGRPSEICPGYRPWPTFK